jgi:predicted ATPase
MLKRFYVDNYKTHINTTYELRPLNLLIGVNNSGKTNLCQAMRFLGATSSLSLSKAALIAAKDEWTVTNAYLGKSTIDFRVDADLQYQSETLSYTYELSVKVLDPAAAQAADTRLAVNRERLAVSGPGLADTPLITNDGGDIRLLHETRKLAQGSDHYVSTSAPLDASMLSRLYDLKDNPRANLFKRYLGGWAYYDLDSQQLRKPEAKMLDTILNEDGSNLASVLFNLKNGNERLYRKLLDITKRVIDQRLDLLAFFSPAENQVFMFGEDAGGRRFGPWTMSNGTLRFLALGYIFLTRQSYEALGGPRVVIVEEPETGLYVGHLKELFSLIDRTGANGQFVFTSHSPYFIDLFDGLLEGITVAKPGERNTPLVRPDVERLRKQLEAMPLGEMHFREMLT